MAPKLKMGKASAAGRLPSPQPKFHSARNHMAKTLIERDEEIDLVLTALIAGHHPLLVGPPGTAKSMLLDTVASWMGVPAFDYLLNKFTDPMELFGPTDLVALKNRQIARVVDGMMPEAEFAFLDEIFKASSAILNTLLKVLNERKFKYGSQEFKCPLRMCVAASNEWPESQEELGALFDRFLFRKTVKPISSRINRQRLLAINVKGQENEARNHRPTFLDKITSAELDQATAEASDLQWTQDAADAIMEIIDLLLKEGIRVSDRRQYQSVGAVQAYAYLNQQQEVKTEHLEVLAHVLWDDPKEQPKKCAEIVAKVANPVGMLVNSLIAQADDVVNSPNSKPLEAQKALEDIADKISRLPVDPRRDKAQAYVAEYIKTNLEKITRADRIAKRPVPSL